jgi:acyl carrier protein
MGQLLMTSAAEFQIGLCPIGALQFPQVRDALHLEDKHICAHSFLGGLAGEAEADSHHAAKFGSQRPAVPDLVGELRRFLSDRLPDFMIPGSFVVLDALPVTASGKVDRAALPPPDAGARGTERARGLPQTEMEQALANALQELLPDAPVGINDNFFDLGANSLHIVRFSQKLNDVMKRDVPVMDMFKYPTIRLLGRHLSEAPEASPLETVGRQAQRQIEAAQKQRRRMERRNG